MTVIITTPETPFVRHRRPSGVVCAILTFSRLPQGARVASSPPRCISFLIMSFGNWVNSHSRHRSALVLQDQVSIGNASLIVKVSVSALNGESRLTSRR